MSGGIEWRLRLNWKYPYKGHTLTNPQYIKDKAALFEKNGNGWWWNDGQGYNPDYETPMQLQRRYRREGSTKKGGE